MERPKLERKIETPAKKEQPKPEMKSKAKKKGKNLNRYQKVQYAKDERGYVVNSTITKKERDGSETVIDKDAFTLHDDMILKENIGITSPITREDAQLLNAQSLNTGIFYKIIE